MTINLLLHFRFLFVLFVEKIMTHTTCIFFDLDDTLYPPETGIWSEIASRINRYMVERIGIPESEAEALRRRYFSQYGTTCNGLRQEHGIDPQDYYRFVHNVDLNGRLAPDPLLRTMLQGLPQRKFIFSNADTAYIRRVLARLAVEDLFEGIIDIFSTGFICKPMDGAYQIAVQKAGSPAPDQCLLVDDLVRNLTPARALGWKTVLVHNPAPPGAADHCIDSILKLAGAVG